MSRRLRNGTVHEGTLPVSDAPLELIEVRDRTSIEFF
jgi:hypothetical protein